MSRLKRDQRATLEVIKRFGTQIGDKWPKGSWVYTRTGYRWRDGYWALIGRDISSIWYRQSCEFSQAEMAIKGIFPSVDIAGNSWLLDEKEGKPKIV